MPTHDETAGARLGTIRLIGRPRSRTDGDVKESVAVFCFDGGGEVAKFMGGDKTFDGGGEPTAVLSVKLDRMVEVDGVFGVCVSGLFSGVPRSDDIESLRGGGVGGSSMVV